MTEKQVKSALKRTIIILILTVILPLPLSAIISSICIIIIAILMLLPLSDAGHFDNAE
jgi:hypothetical protein